MHAIRSTRLLELSAKRSLRQVFAVRGVGHCFLVNHLPSSGLRAIVTSSMLANNRPKVSP